MQATLSDCVDRLVRIEILSGWGGAMVKARYSPPVLVCTISPPHPWPTAAAGRHAVLRLPREGLFLRNLSSAIIGLPRDRVQMIRGLLKINGEPVANVQKYEHDFPRYRRIPPRATVAHQALARRPCRGGVDPYDPRSHGWRARLTYPRSTRSGRSPNSMMGDKFAERPQQIVRS